MKKTILFFVAIIFSWHVSAQVVNHSGHAKNTNDYKTGVMYFNQGNYALADSAFERFLQTHSADQNAIYSLAVTELYLKDTVHFCKRMLHLCNWFNDQDARKLYFSICGNADTVFRNGKYLPCTRKKAHYMVVTESHKYDPYKTVLIHKKHAAVNSVIVGSGFTFKMKNIDIIAMYHLYPDGKKIFTSLAYYQPCIANANGDNIRKYLENKTEIKKVKKILNLNTKYISFSFIIHKDGKCTDAKILAPDKLLTDKKKKAQLESYINSILAGLPKVKPARFIKERVNYLDEEVIFL